MDKERWERKEEDAIKAAAKKRRRLRRIKADELRRMREMGEVVRDGDEDEGMEEGNDEAEAEEDEEGLSSDTNEITDSD